MRQRADASIRNVVLSPESGRESEGDLTSLHSQTRTLGRMAAEGNLFQGRWDLGTIAVDLKVIWEMSDQMFETVAWKPATEMGLAT